MFKALLKTIPSLSGNMKLSCFIDDCKKSKSYYISNIKTAKLLPISHTLYDNNIFVNLKNNAFEYDVKKFYRYYFDIFYKSNFNYSKQNIPIIDFSDINRDSNEDFYFGCKRISYTKYGNQLAFFAPIYIEGVEDLKDKYFKITCIFDKINNVKKELVIDIYDNHNDENYLANYLIKYASQIDDKVIYMSESYKNMYYGIDLLHGGFIHIEDNISKNLYNKYYTINDFDAILNFGFKRNSMMMKQIIPLSFYFNPQDLLSPYEKTIFKDAKITIYGEWYTKGNQHPEKFYNFSDNYNFYNESLYKLSNNNEFSFVTNYNNIMDLGYPALNEASSENYRYVNTVIKNYNRWKLKYSSDENPYIINNNFAFSKNQESFYQYKEFPINYKPLYGICKYIPNKGYNLNFDLFDIYSDTTNKIINNKKQYYDLFNKNYIANFYNLLVKDNGKYENIFTNSKYWIDVDKDDKIYQNGILYDFNKLYNKYSNMPRIDKFSVFVNPEMMSYISNEEYNNTYYSSKYVIYKDLNGLSYMDYSYNGILNLNTTSSISNNKIVYKNPEGDFVDINSYYIHVDNGKKLHYNNSLYIDIHEMFLYFNILSSYDQYANYSDTYFNQLYNIIYNIFENNNKIIQGFKTIDINYKHNIISDIFIDKNTSTKSSFIFNSHILEENNEAYWVYDRLWFSIYPNRPKYKLLENYSLLNKTKENTKIILYLESDFVLYDDLINELQKLKERIENSSEVSSDNINNFIYNLYSLISKYYVTNTLYDRNDKQSYSDMCFVPLTKHENDYGINSFCKLKDDNFKIENILFVDIYNLKNLYSKYFRNEDLNLIKVKDCYCNFLNIEHFRKYFEKLYLDENLDKSNSNNSIDNIYVKIHIINNIYKYNLSTQNDIYKNLDDLNIIVTTEYVPLRKYFKNLHENLNDPNILLNYINYNDDGYFYFTDNCFNFENGKKTTHLFSELTDDKYNIVNFELCFKKTIGIVNDQLYKLIMQLNSHNLFKDLYLYKLYNTKDYRYEYTINNININDKNVEQKLKDIITVPISNEIPENAPILLMSVNNEEEIEKVNNDTIELYPYFNNIYNEEKEHTKIYNDSFLNNIIKSNIVLQEDNELSEISYVYKYNVYNIDCLTYLPKNKYPEYEDYRYSLYENYNNHMVSNSNDFITYYMDYADITSISSYYNNYDNLITYTNENNITYGFYVLHLEFDNTCNTLNLINENNNKINVVSYINGISVKTIYDNQSSYLSKYYHNLIPYINNSNIVKDFLNESSIIKYPNKCILTNIYKQFPNVDNNKNIYSYNIIVNGKNNIQLLRYFDNIIPYLYNSNTVTSYYLYYKNTNNYIENDLYNKRNLSYIMYQKNINIYSDKQVSYYYIDGGNINIHNFTPVEYKNFNNNRFYNLETNIEINLTSHNIENKNLFTKQEIDNIENDPEVLYNYFKEYLTNKNNLLTDNDILFLYKKYNISFSHTIKGFHKNSKGQRDYDLYTLIIKYNLL